MIHIYDKKKLHNPINIIKISIQKLVAFFYIFAMEKNIKYLGLEIIEAIQAGTTVDKVYIQKEASSN
jgi:uncharacterized phage-associated protein